MTRVLVPQPNIEADVSAERVGAYLLRPGSGWTHEPDTSEHWHTFTLGLLCANVPRSAMVGGARRLTECILDIARAEQRHPSAVLADITGPACGVGGRGCGGRGWRCYAVSLDYGVDMSRADTADECSAPHGAQEESDQ